MANENAIAIATLYAEALLELVVERNQIDTVREEFSSLAEALKADEELAQFLETPAIGSEQKKAGLRRILDGKVSELFMDFLMVVADKDRLSILGDMASVFEDLLDRRKGRIRGRLTTAVELEPGRLEQIAAQIGAALGKSVALESHVDANILGGMILNVDDTLIDGSVRRRLQLLQRQLQKAGSDALRASERYIA